jgi:hypothetical protein
MAYFDSKQKKLINSWRELGEKSEDSYMAYIAEWIAFNAICYNLYYQRAVIERATIDRSKSKLDRINEILNQKSELIPENALISKSSKKVNIDLSLPERLFISIANNYTEDIIFNEFVKNHESWYNSFPSNSFIDLQESLRKKDRFFVINMAKELEYDSEGSIKEMADKNIIILCEKNNLKTIKNVLYQIRCNIFHGEKTPGDINDDRIVKHALPVLKYLVAYLIKDNEIDTNT